MRTEDNCQGTQHAVIGAILVVGMLAVVTAYALSGRGTTLRRGHTWALSYDVNALEAPLLDMQFGSRRLAVMLDTGYAGPPVVNTSALAAEEDAVRKLGSERRWNRLDVRRRAAYVYAGGNSRIASAVRFGKKSGCVLYTSGCTMRLMSIGSTNERRANLLLCPPAAAMPLGTDRLPVTSPHNAIDAQVWVSNVLPHTPHIYTMDALRHDAPVLISAKKGKVQFLPRPLPRRWCAKHGFWPAHASLEAGSFMVPCTVGGVKGHFTVDTGYGGTAALSSVFAARIDAARMTCTGQTLTQHGANGEAVSCKVCLLSFGIADVNVTGPVPMLVNSTPVDAADGYIGMGILRMFDMVVDHGGTLWLKYHGWQAPTENFYRSAL